jgi:hypothetical protein
MFRALLFYVLTKTGGNLVFLRVLTQELLENVRIIRDSVWYGFSGIFQRTPHKPI